MNILYIVSGLSTRGGIERFCKNIISEIDLSKYRIDFLVTDTHVDEEESFYENLGCTIYHIDGTGNPFQRVKRKKAFFKNCPKRYDIVHIHTVLTTAYMFAKLADKCWGAKVIVHSHIAGDYKGIRWKNLLFRKSLVKHSQYKMACSKTSAEFLFGEKAGHDAFILYNPVDVERFSFNKEDREEKRKALGFDEDEFLLLAVGRLVEQKNYPFLLKAFKELMDRNIKTKLIVCGDGEEREQIEQYIKSNDLGEKVFLLGNVSDVEKWMSCADCFVLPSVYEGLPTVLVEAQTSGLPILFSETITKEVIFDDKAIELSIEDIKIWADAVQSLASEKQKRNAANKECLEKGKDNFSVKSITARLEEHYDRIVNE